MDTFLFFFQLGKEYVTYENEIFFSRKLRALKNPADSSNMDRYLQPQVFQLFTSHELVTR